MFYLDIATGRGTARLRAAMRRGRQRVVAIGRPVAARTAVATRRSEDDEPAASVSAGPAWESRRSRAAPAPSGVRESLDPRRWRRLLVTCTPVNTWRVAECPFARAWRKSRSPAMRHLPAANQQPEAARRRPSRRQVLDRDVEGAGLRRVIERRRAVAAPQVTAFPPDAVSHGVDVLHGVAVEAHLLGLEASRKVSGPALRVRDARTLRNQLDTASRQTMAWPA